MIQGFQFTITLMEGVETIQSHTSVFTSCELAEQALKASKLANARNGGLSPNIRFSGIEETCIFESEDEVPILKEGRKTDFRTIGFRGKDHKTGEWIYGDLFHLGDGSPCLVNTRKQVFCCKEVQPETVGQFTGLTDKEGKEIYEGDIVHGYYKNRYGKQTLVCLIGWDSENACFEIRPQVDPDDETGLLSEPDEITVIGNIHDNPELLDEKTVD